MPIGSSFRDNIDFSLEQCANETATEVIISSAPHPSTFSSVSSSDSSALPSSYSSTLSSSRVCAPLCANTSCKNYTGSPCFLCQFCCRDILCVFPSHVCEQIRNQYFRKGAPKSFPHCDIKRDIQRCENRLLRLDLEKLLELSDPNSLHVSLPVPSYAKCSRAKPVIQTSLLSDQSSRFLLFPEPTAPRTTTTATTPSTKALTSLAVIPTPPFALKAKLPTHPVFDQSAYNFVLPLSTNFLSSTKGASSKTKTSVSPSSPSRSFLVRATSRFLPPALSTTTPSSVALTSSVSLTSTFERWDLALVDSLLASPHLLLKQDLRILLDVRANATPEGLYYLHYSFADGADSGRKYTGGKGYQAVSRDIRTLCSSRFYVEDDIVNAFPTILNQVFKRNGLSTPFLTAYISDREHLLLENSSPSLPREALKKLFLISLHFGDYLSNNAFAPIHFLSCFQSEIRSNAKALLLNPVFASLYSRALSLNKRNALGTLVSWICQRAESEIMQAKTEFTERYYRVATNLFDGHLREIGELDLSACSLFVEEKTGYKVSFVTKSHVANTSCTPSPVVCSSCSTSPPSSVPMCDIVAIRGDGHCILRLAGEINAILRNPNHLASGYAPCLADDLAKARAETVTNFTSWLTEKKEFFSSQQEVDNFVFETVNDTIEEFCNRVEGKCRGKGLLASNIDLAAFARDKDVQFIILRTIELTATSASSDCTNAFTLCDFPGQVDKKRIAIVILHRGHVDLFVLRTANRVQVLFEIGTEFEFARVCALSFIRTLVKETESENGFSVALTRPRSGSSKWPKWCSTFAAFQISRSTAPFQHVRLPVSTTPACAQPSFSSPSSAASPLFDDGSVVRALASQFSPAAAAEATSFTSTATFEVSTPNLPKQ